MKPVRVPPTVSGINLYTQVGPNSVLQTNQPIGDYILDDDDDGDIVYINSAALAVVQLPANFPPGYSVTVYQEGGGQVSFVPLPGAALQALNGKRGISGQYGHAVLSVRANLDGMSADWRVRGDLAAAKLGDNVVFPSAAALNSDVDMRQQITAGFGGSGSMTPRPSQRRSATATLVPAATLAAIGQSPH